MSTAGRSSPPLKEPPRPSRWTAGLLADLEIEEHGSDIQNQPTTASTENQLSPASQRNRITRLESYFEDLNLLNIKLTGELEGTKFHIKSLEEEITRLREYIQGVEDRRNELEVAAMRHEYERLALQTEVEMLRAQIVRLVFYEACP